MSNLRKGPVLGRDNCRSPPDLVIVLDDSSEVVVLEALFCKPPAPPPPALCVAPWPPVAACDPDAAFEILAMDVSVPEDPSSGRAKIFAELINAFELVKKPVFMSAVASRGKRELRDIEDAKGLFFKCCTYLSKEILDSHAISDRED